MKDVQYVVGSRGVETFITVLNETQELRLADVTNNERYYIPLSQIDELIVILQQIKGETNHE